MEQPNNIDQQFRQRLQHAAVPPPDFVWANVERAIRRPRRRRLFFLWLFAACLTSAGLWALWQHFGMAPAAAVKHDQANTPTAVQDQRHSAEHNTRTQGVQPPGLSPVVTPATDPLTAGDAIPGPEKPTPPMHKSEPVARLSQTARDVMADKNTAVQLPQAAEAPKLAELRANARALDLQTAFLAGQAPTSFSLSEVAVLPRGISGSLSAPGRLPTLTRLKLPPIKKKAPKKCYDFHSNREAWLFDAYAGPSLINKQLDTGDPEYKSYVQDRLGSEKHQWAFNAGIRASYLFAGNFALRTGLHYDQFVEQFEYIDPDFIKYTVVITQQYVNGQWVSVPDTVDIQYGANYVKTYNRFALLDIPLQAALELRSGATGISLNLGGSVNVLFQKRGSMLSVADTPVDLEQYQVFRPKVGLSLLGSIQWFFHVTPRTRVFAEPYYRHILEPVTQPGYPVDQSYGIGGIRFGVTQIIDRKGN